jgi:predicted AAA+ superfamily ATPase
MIQRTFWIQKIEQAWQRAPIVWLTGVRRVGKTTLSKHWKDEAIFFNCDLPRNRKLLEDPEAVFQQIDQKIVILDEIHQTENPSEILKIAADEFPHLRILATGSSTLSATKKFKDSLTGRKRVVHLCPVLATELASFSISRLEDRLLRGGLPDRLLSAEPDPEFYSEWLDSFFARDVQELFQVDKRSEFLKLCQLLLRQSGELASQTTLSKHSGLSRPSVVKYLDMLETTHFIHILRPYHGGGRRELLAQPKIYGFDTGFIAHFRDWQSLRPTDCGGLLEHLVLDLLRAYFPTQPIYFWRDKQQREIDFVLALPDGTLTAIECKWSRSNFETRNLDAFRAAYPKGKNLIVTASPGDPFETKVGIHAVQICQLDRLIDALSLNL